MSFGLVGALNPTFGPSRNSSSAGSQKFGLCDFLAVWLFPFDVSTLDFESQTLDSDFRFKTFNGSDLSKSTDMNKVQKVKAQTSRSKFKVQNPKSKDDVSHFSE